MQLVRDMRVPFVDLRAQNLDLSTELVSAFERVLASAAFVLGAEVADFERRAAAHLGVSHAVGVSSGTDALLVALMAFGVGPGDEVITTPLSFVSTAEAVLRVGATLKFVDVTPTALTLDPERVEAAVTARTRAIIPVHLYGRMAPMDVLSDIADRRRLLLLEDAAQAYGSRFGGRSAGSWGRAGCFSFFPSKILGAAGDAGLVVTNDDELAGRLRRLRQHGSEGEGRYGALGGNFRIDALQAALLSAKMRHVERWILERREHTLAYDVAFGGIPALSPVGGSTAEGWNAAIYTLRVREGRRDELRRFLADRGVETRVYYDPPLHLQPVFTPHARGSGTLPVSERAAGEVLSLPLYPELRRDEREHVIATVRAFFGR
jgi:dTDP-4-amino-4,6-dideoxygalactose transaminase